MPSRNTLSQSFPNCSFHILSDILDRNLHQLEGVSTNTNPNPGPGISSSSSTLRTLLVEAEGNTWSRSSRRSRRRIDSSSTISPPPPSSSSTRQPTLTCSVCVIETSNQAAAEGQCLVLEIQWLYGTDRTLFESFASHLWRKVGDDLQNQKTLATG